MAKPIRVRDLKDQTGMDYPRPVLYCSCGGEYSANAGDYFTANPDTIIRCECGKPLQLGVPVFGYRPVEVQS